ncbi:pirin family protein [Neptunicella marina]|uniref:Pirin family protein n=1 Tax=Neptunicella marina TaxID=2125989 RepID=A0A8J6IQV7_9ALTE|nr:pirin family protein [Neptunicella marina]MBC3764729.1 pirin family protein [Neptunicella marina]
MQPNHSKLLDAKEKDLGEMTVRRTIPAVGCKAIGPWVFFDHMGPVTFNAGNGVNVRPHPHINLATVTYLFEGEILHRDSLGSYQPITPGAINLMVAGKGIVHSERERDEVKNQQHSLHGLQLWMALPEEDEQMEPQFHHIDAASIPQFNHEGTDVRLLMGHAYSQQSPVKTFSPTLFMQLDIPQGKSLTLPSNQQTGIYLINGDVLINQQPLAQHQMYVSEEQQIAIQAETHCTVIVIGGDNLGKRYLDWNFVSSNPQRIEQARNKWKNGGFPIIEDDNDEFIPLPE